MNYFDAWLSLVPFSHLLSLISCGYCFRYRTPASSNLVPASLGAVLHLDFGLRKNMGCKLYGILVWKLWAQDYEIYTSHLVSFFFFFFNWGWILLARNILPVAFVTHKESGRSSKYCQPRDCVRRRDGGNLFTRVPLFIFTESKNTKHE